LRYSKRCSWRPCREIESGKLKIESERQNTINAKNLIKSFLRKQDFFFMIARVITVRGKVQGVFYRASAKEKAYALGLWGWVKNEPDESVVIWVEGPEIEVLQFIDWCWIGSGRARVEDVAVKVVEKKAYKDFEVIR
jgi:acylphosphatase